MPDPSLSRPNPDLSAAEPPATVDSSDAGGLHADLGRAASTKAPALLDAALRLVTSLASGTVRQADGVSVTLERHGQMMTVAASDDTIRRMDDHQYATGEGPCLAAAADGRSYHSELLAEEERWPVFVPLAIGDGINSILSNPLIVSAQPVGALNIYSRTGWAFGPFECQVAALFADHAAAILAEVVEIDSVRGVRIPARDVTVRSEAVAIVDSTSTRGPGPGEDHG